MARVEFKRVDLQIIVRRAQDGGARLLAGYPGSYDEQRIAGETAGEALLAVRRALLAKSNPLGLIYTLYAPAHLTLDKDGDGKCQKPDNRH